MYTVEIKNARYLYGFAQLSQYRPLEMPEIAVAGKSNVGKSSFINMLTNINGLAKVGQTPGKTRMINVFLLNGSFTLMDLPGYGYAKVARSEQERFSRLIEGYLHASQRLKHVFLLLDVRHTPTQDDLMMINWLSFYHVPFSVIATKADKLSKAQLARRRQELSRETGLIASEIFPVSSVTRQGKEAICDRLAMLLAHENDAGDQNELAE